MVNYNELKMQLKGLIDGDESKISILPEFYSCYAIKADHLHKL